MIVYNQEEMEFGIYLATNFRFKQRSANDKFYLARQLMLIFDTYRYRLYGLSEVDLGGFVLETAHHFDNKVSYSYTYLPTAWIGYLNAKLGHKTYQDMANWFFSVKSQPRDFLLYGVLKQKSLMREPIRKDSEVKIEIKHQVETITYKGN